MQCPHCGEYENKVVKSELRIQDNRRIRIRICMRCGARLDTEEKILLNKFRKLNPRKSVNVKD